MIIVLNIKYVFRSLKYFIYHHENISNFKHHEKYFYCDLFLGLTKIVAAHKSNRVTK